MNTYSLFWVSLVEGVGRKTLEELYQLVKERQIKWDDHPLSVDGIFNELASSNRRIKVPSRLQIESAKTRAEKIIEVSTRNGISVISIFDKAYPPLLKKITDRPFILHAKGNLDCLHEPSIAVIGTRDPSDHAKKMGERLTLRFCENGFTIVSGLAKGCDSIAHETACRANHPTAAFLAGGLDKIYPAENKPLAQRILDTDGVLVSEYEYGKASQPSYFVERDRLQSGSSMGLVVLETGIKGGTRHTVSFAEKQGRPIGCLYTHVLDKYKLDNSEKFQGNIDIVRNQGGIKLTEVESIESFINIIKERNPEFNFLKDTHHSKQEIPNEQIAPDPVVRSHKFFINVNRNTLVDPATDNTPKPPHSIINDEISSLKAALLEKRMKFDQEEKVREDTFKKKQLVAEKKFHEDQKIRKDKFEKKLNTEKEKLLKAAKSTKKLKKDQPKLF